MGFFRNPSMKWFTFYDDETGEPDPGELHTFTGKIIRFLAKRTNAVKSLSANFTPIQNLNGYDAPWPPGGGKNKFPNVLPANTINAKIGSGSIQSAANARVFAIPCKTNTDYCFSQMSTGDGWIAAFGDKLPAVGDVVYSEKILTYYTTYTMNSGTHTYILIHVSSEDVFAALNNSTFLTMIEEGTTRSATYSPYSNECPITGHTGCEVYDNGVQQWDEEWELGGYSSQTGQPVAQSNTIRSKNNNPIPIKPNTDYYIGIFGTGSVYLFWYGLNGDYLGSSVGYVSSGVRTTPNNAYYLRFQCNSQYGTTYNHDISINYPSTDHDYHAYSGTTVSISFGQTVYGCQLTVNEDGSGQIVAKWKGVDMGNLPWQYITTSNRNYFYVGFSDKTTLASDLICSIYPYGGSKLDSQMRSADDFTIYSETGYGAVKVKDSRYTDGNTFKTALTGQTLLYELATPITIPVTAQQIQTLVGENVVLVDGSSGDITVQAFGTEIV